MVRITVIWLSVKYQNFFTFQDVKYAYPPHTVNVPFISSHIKYQGRHKKRIYQHDSFTFHVGFSLWFFFFTWSWIQFFFKEILLVIRNFRITMSEMELVFRRAERRCSGSLFSMLLFIKLYRMQIFNQYLLNKKDDTCLLLNTNIAASIELSLWRFKRCPEHLMVKFVSTLDYLIPPISNCIPERAWA